MELRARALVTRGVLRGSLVLLLVRGAVVSLLSLPPTEEREMRPVDGDKKQYHRRPPPVPRVDVLVISGHVDPIHLRVRGRSVARISEAGRDPSSRHSVRLEDAHGVELYRVAIGWSWMGCGGWYFNVEAPWDADLRRVVLLDGEDELDRVEASPSAPRILSFEPAPGVYDARELVQRWKVDDPDGDRLTISGSGLFSDDRTHYQRKGILQVVASDGFWETRVVRSYAIIPGTNTIVIRDGPANEDW